MTTWFLRRRSTMRVSHVLCVHTSNLSFTGQRATGSTHFPNSKRIGIVRRKLSLRAVSDLSNPSTCAEHFSDFLQSCRLCSPSSSPRAIVSRVRPCDDSSLFFTHSNLIKGSPFIRHNRSSPHPFIMAAFNYGTTEWGFWWIGLMNTMVRTSSNASFTNFNSPLGPVRAVAFHPSRQLLCTGGDDYKIKVWGEFLPFVHRA